MTKGKEPRKGILCRCPICDRDCWIHKTRTGREYSFYCVTSNHRGFIDARDEIHRIFKIPAGASLEEVVHGIEDSQKEQRPGTGISRRSGTAAKFIEEFFRDAG